MWSEQLSTLVESARGRDRLVFLDYDGTLVPFAAKPHLARPDPELIALLQKLSERADTTVHIVTGRSRVSIDAWLGHLAIGLHAEHGYWTRGPTDAAWQARAPRSSAWMLEAKAVLHAITIGVPGSIVEEKEAGMAWHYRLSETAIAAKGAALLRAAVDQLCVRHGLEILDGDKVVELRSRGTHKGHVVRELALAATARETVIAVGDDVTDDDMFAALPAGAVAIAVAERPRTGHIRVPDHVAVRGLLERLCETPSSHRRLRAAAVESDAP